MEICSFLNVVILRVFEDFGVDEGKQVEDFGFDKKLNFLLQLQIYGEMESQEVDEKVEVGRDPGSGKKQNGME